MNPERNTIGSSKFQQVAERTGCFLNQEVLARALQYSDSALAVESYHLFSVYF